MVDGQAAGKPKPAGPADVKAAAATILQNAGRDGASLDAAAALYTEASRASATRTQFAGRPAAPPEWTR